MLASNGTGVDTAAPAGTHRDGHFSGTFTLWSAGTDADTATPDWDYGSRNPAAAPSSGNAGSCVATGSGSQGLDYDSHGVGRCSELDEAFPCMLPGWSAEKVGDNYMMILPRVTAQRD